MRFGVHVSIGGGLAKAVAKAEAAGCESFQIFAGNPRGWARGLLPQPDVASYRAALARSGLGPVLVHLSYLPNPASLDDALYDRSIAAMQEDFSRANRLGAEYFVVHPGSCPPEAKPEAMARIIRGVEKVLAATPGPTTLLLENQGSRRRDIAADLAELAALLDRLDPDRVGVCLDTCHAFAAGYDLRHEAGWREALSILAEAGNGRLKAIHANDSKGELGSGLDRHEHIGLGRLGEAAFIALGRLAELADLPVVLETPQDDPGDDLRNLTRIRDLTGGRA